MASRCLISQLMAGDRDLHNAKRLIPDNNRAAALLSNPLKLKNSQRHYHRHGHGGDAFFATDEAHGFVGCGLDAYPRRIELECGAHG